MTTRTREAAKTSAPPRARTEPIGPKTLAGRAAGVRHLSYGRTGSVIELPAVRMLPHVTDDGRHDGHAQEPEIVLGLTATTAVAATVCPARAVP